MNEDLLVKIDDVYEIVKKISTKKFQKKYDKKTVEQLLALQARYLEKGEIKALCEIGNKINEKHKEYGFKLYHYCGINKGELEGLYNLGSCYWFGRGTSMSSKKSYKIFRDLYKRNYSHAAFVLATIHNPLSDLNKIQENRFVKDKIIKTNVEKALWYYKKAAEFEPECSEYIYVFGDLLNNGKIVKRNESVAMKYFQKCVDLAKRENKSKDFFAVKSLLDMAKMCQDKSYKKAKEWILLSHHFGNKNYKNDIDVLNRKMRVKKKLRAPVFKPKLRLDRLLEAVHKMDEMAPSRFVKSVKVNKYTNVTIDGLKSTTETPPPTPINTSNLFNVSIDAEEVIQMLEEQKLDIKDIKSPQRTPPSRRKKKEENKK